MQEVAKLAGWGDEQIEYMKEKVTEEGKKEEVNKGKLPAQVFFCHFSFVGCEFWNSNVKTVKEKKQKPLNSSHCVCPFSAMPTDFG